MTIIDYTNRNVTKIFLYFKYISWLSKQKNNR